VKLAILTLFCLLLNGCTLLKMNEEAEQSPRKVSPQAAHLQ